MKRRVCIVGVGGALAAALGLGACGDDAVPVEGDTRIAEGELTEGVVVRIQGALATVTLPFVDPVPEVDDDEFEDELQGSVALFVASELSGAAADLAAGTLVDGTPAAPGEFAWELDEERLEATLTFFNESPGGLTLSIGQPYRAQLTVTPNAYVATLSAISFPVAVMGG